MKLEELKGKKILIIGFGLEGKATYDFLKQVFPNAVIAVTDKKDGNDYLEKQKNYDIAIKSPGVHKSLVTIPYTTATNIFFANVRGTTIGVTGSKGKSTTSSLIYSILKEDKRKAHLVGNITHKLDVIGTPMLTELAKSNTADDIWVCELSSFMLDDIAYSPHISVITSFFPEHMDYHGSIENYFTAKARIISQATPNDYFVYNPNFPELQVLAGQTKAQAFAFTNDLPLPTSNLPLIGEHNKSNIRAAVTVGEILKISNSTIARAIQTFKPLPHRLENAGTFNGITFYDDAISTTPQSTIQAIEALEPIGTIFLGGQDRGFDFNELAVTIAKSDIANIVLFPESGEKIYSAIKSETDQEFNVLRTSSMEEAILFAYKYTPAGTICLLSTASPSYSIWKNFEEKGNLFKQCARELFQKTSNT